MNTVNEFSQYIKIIGKGQRAGRYLTLEEAYHAYSLILNGQAEPEQVGAFLMLLRVREESAEELAGFVKACREFNKPELTQLKINLDLGCYAGKRRHLPWFLLAVICLAQSGKRIFLHGTKEPDSKRLYLSEVLQQLGLPISTDIGQVQTSLSKFGFAYMDLININSGLNHLIQLRALFALRSSANTLARMLNPSNATYSFHGVFHRHFDQRHVEVAQLLNDPQVSCIRGDGGEVEVNPERAFTQYFCRNGELSTIEFPELLPQRQIKPAQLNIDELKQVWAGELEYEYANQAVVGTLASYLLLMENQDDVEQALIKAKSMWLNRDLSFFKTP